MSDNPRKPHLVIASGGTGGHFYPTLAVAQAFRELGGVVTLLVSGIHSPEQKQIAQDYKFAAVELPFVRLPSSLGELLSFPWRLWHCRRRAKQVISSLHCDVLLGMGSFAAYPACLAGLSLKIPLVLHEGNAHMGRVNRLLTGRAKSVGLSLPLRDERQLHGCRSELVGMPLREALVKAAIDGDPDGTTRREYLGQLGLSPDKQTVLVFGGSQGALIINRLLKDTAASLAEFRDRIQFIHLTGHEDNEELITAYKNAGLQASVRQAEPHIEKCYLSSDLVVCRGGASSICELALFGLPSILIPLPTAAEGHQLVNAQMLAEKNCAVALVQEEASIQVLNGMFKDWQANPAKWQAYGDNLKQYARPQAAMDMARMIVGVLPQDWQDALSPKNGGK